MRHISKDIYYSAIYRLCLHLSPISCQFITLIVMLYLLNVNVLVVVFSFISVERCNLLLALYTKRDGQAMYHMIYRQYVFILLQSIIYTDNNMVLYIHVFYIHKYMLYTLIHESSANMDWSNCLNSLLN